MVHHIAWCNAVCVFTIRKPHKPHALYILIYFFLILLIPIFTTHFIQAQFMYYILFYSFKHDPSLCELWEKLRKCGLEGMGRFLSDLLREPSPCVLPSEQGTLVAPQAHGGGLVSKIFTSKQLLCSWWLRSKVFYPNPFFPLKMVGFHWPTSAVSSHLVKPFNGLKQLKMRSQWGFSQAFPLIMIKVILHFIQTKANLKITTCLTSWGPKPFLLTKN